MYNCGFCHNTSKPKESMTRIVTETRDKEYNNYGKVSYGSEIVKEVPACLSCATLRLGKSDIVASLPNVVAISKAESRRINWLKAINKTNE